MQLPGEFSPFIEKKVVFCLVVGGVTPPPLLVVRPLKKPLFFYVCLPLTLHFSLLFDVYYYVGYSTIGFIAA